MKTKLRGKSNGLHNKDSVVPTKGVKNSRAHRRDAEIAEVTLRRGRFIHAFSGTKIGNRFHTVSSVGGISGTGLAEKYVDRVYDAAPKNRGPEGPQEQVYPEVTSSKVSLRTGWTLPARRRYELEDLTS